MPPPPEPLIVIPARLAATRLPGKPLAQIAGVPMVVRVMRRAQQAAIGPVVVAAGDTAIVAVVTAAGGQAVLTDPDLPSGSDRVHAAAEQIDPDGRYGAVINLQGDLPGVDPAALTAAWACLARRDVAIGTLVAPLTADDRDNPDAVKAVVDMPPEAARGRALYFSRAAVPWGEGPLYHHIGIYAYRRVALRRFVSLAPSPLERRERLEQLRALGAGMRIDAALVAEAPLSVDTPADLDRARTLLEGS